ncbi:hypothetical protein ABMA27_016931 [Loxostege sticticalis]|uniref:YqaJ viral recombinase domain-containing protein n=1 Tax=Loxostege sticticalis TaxID=481309 RepID=A0ABR3GYW3_LOXSC
MRKGYYKVDDYLNDKSVWPQNCSALTIKKLKPSPILRLISQSYPPAALDHGSDESFGELDELSDSNNHVVEGRRIIDFQYFWSQLINISKHNERFGCNLTYLKIEKEKQVGLISKFDLKCKMCGSCFVLKTSEADTSEEAKLDLNKGAVSGAIMTGIGLSNLNEITASMDLPTMSFRLYSKTHDAISDMWKTAAEETMVNAAKQEIEAAKTRGEVSNTGIAMIPVEADACWGKRSYKNNYSALSGVAAIIGEHSGKVFHIGVRNKYCVICARSNKKGQPAKAHKCSKNHSGSSTSMEQSILVEGFKNSIRERNLIYKTLIADGDSSTYKSILESRPYPDIPIQKIECTNHLLRNYNGKNLLLQKDTSIPLNERKLLNVDRLKRLRTAVRGAIKYRQQDSGTESSKIENLQKDIVNSPRHIFGDHSECSSYYCTEERKKEPNLVPLVPTLLLKLKKHASQLAYNSRSLLKCYTNNRAEQFNSIVAKMVGGKRVNFSLKDSYSTRCYAAVVAFNTGKPQYTLYKSICHASPGKSLKLLEARRHSKNIREVMARKGCARKIINCNPVDAHYGNNCERPDMDADDYERGKDLFLINLREQASKRHEIERATVLQAESSLWLELRRCILTASFFGKVCKRRANQNSAPLVKSILYTYNLDHIFSVKHGRDNEPKALAQLSVQEKLTIEKCGLFIDEELFYLGATPDGLCDEGIVEIKCPSSLFGINPDTAIETKKLKCFKLNSASQVVINQNHEWYYQVQGQLHITKKDVCLFSVWTGPEFPVKVVRVVRDDVFWQEKMLPKLTRFYQSCVLPEIIDPRKTRSMPLRQIFI